MNYCEVFALHDDAPAGARGGPFCGGSCGMAAAGALKWLRGSGSALGEDDVVVVLLPDSGSRYLSKIFDHNWMRENGSRVVHGGRPDRRAPARGD